VPGTSWLGVETVGTDAGQAGTFDPPFPTHTLMHGAGKFGLASLRNLDQLPATGAVPAARYGCWRWWRGKASGLAAAAACSPAAKHLALLPAGLLPARPPRVEADFLSSLIRALPSG
jgi:hypothetical protein